MENWKQITIILLKINEKIKLAWLHLFWEIVLPSFIYFLSKRSIVVIRDGGGLPQYHQEFCSINLGDTGLLWSTQVGNGTFWRQLARCSGRDREWSRLWSPCVEYKNAIGVVALAEVVILLIDFLFVCMYMYMHVCIYVDSVCHFTGISKAKSWDTPCKHAYRTDLKAWRLNWAPLCAQGLVVAPSPHSKSLVIPTCTLFAVTAVAKLWSMEHSRQLWPKQGEGLGGQRKKRRKVHWQDGSTSKDVCHQALISVSRTRLVEGKMATS